MPPNACTAAHHPGHGIGSETQRPFACVIVGGIVSGTLFTLVLMPLPLVLWLYGQLSEPDSDPSDPDVGARSTDDELHLKGG